MSLLLKLIIFVSCANAFSTKDINRYFAPQMPISDQSQELLLSQKIASLETLNDSAEEIKSNSDILLKERIQRAQTQAPNQAERNTWNFQKNYFNYLFNIHKLDKEFMNEINKDKKYGQIISNGNKITKQQIQSQPKLKKIRSSLRMNISRLKNLILKYQKKGTLTIKYGFNVKKLKTSQVTSEKLY